MQNNVKRIGIALNGLSCYNKYVMADDQSTQKEFFEFEKSKKRGPVFGRIFTRTNVAITLTLERIVFISIGLIMLMVIIYALGIEKGKSLRAPSIKPVEVKKPIEVKLPSEGKTDAALVKTQPIQSIETPYTIVAVTLARKDGASIEANRLKRDGYEAFVVQSDSYFLVCIGAYPDKDSLQSKKALSKIRQIYKDAYFRLR